MSDHHEHEERAAAEEMRAGDVTALSVIVAVPQRYLDARRYLSRLDDEAERTGRYVAYDEARADLADLALDLLNASIDAFQETQRQWDAETRRVETYATANCCCHWGAAVSGEYPEDPCRHCPVHSDPTNDYQCRRHRLEDK